MLGINLGDSYMQSLCSAFVLCLWALYGFSHFGVLRCWDASVTSYPNLLCVRSSFLGDWGVLYVRGGLREEKEKRKREGGRERESKRMTWLKPGERC